MSDNQEASTLIRSFFNMRYTFPGFTFLILVTLSLADKIPNLLTPLGDIAGSALFGLLYILDGAPLGFLVSQPWFVLWKSRIVPDSEYVSEVRENRILGVTETDPQNKVLAAVDFYLISGNPSIISEHVRRRLDIMTLLGSEMSALTCGLIVSVIARIMLWSFSLLAVGLWIGTLGLIAVLFKACEQAVDEHESAAIFALRKAIEEKKSSSSRDYGLAIQ